MNVFSNFYLMRDICGLNCKLNNNDCALAELWDVLKLRIQLNQCMDWLVLTGCAEAGNIQFMEWLTENRVQGWHSVISVAARYGRLDMVKWLFANRPEESTYESLVDALDCAAEKGYLDIVKWLYETMQTNPKTKRRIDGFIVVALDHASEHGAVEVVEWLFKRSPNVHKTFFKEFANNNWTPRVIKWVFENNPELQKPVP